MCKLLVAALVARALIAVSALTNGDSQDACDDVEAFSAVFLQTDSIIVHAHSQTPVSQSSNAVAPSGGFGKVQEPIHTSPVTSCAQLENVLQTSTYSTNGDSQDACDDVEAYSAVFLQTDSIIVHSHLQTPVSQSSNAVAPSGGFAKVQEHIHTSPVTSCAQLENVLQASTYSPHDVTNGDSQDACDDVEAYSAVFIQTDSIIVHSHSQTPVSQSSNAVAPSGGFAKVQEHIHTSPVTSCAQLEKVLQTSTYSPHSIMLLARMLAQFGGERSCMPIKIGLQCARVVGIVLLVGLASICSAGLLLAAMELQQFGVAKRWRRLPLDSCLGPDLLNVQGIRRKDAKGSDQLSDIFAEAAASLRDAGTRADSAEILRIAAEVVERRLNWSALDAGSKSVAIKQLKGMDGRLPLPIAVWIAHASLELLLASLVAPADNKKIVFEGGQNQSARLDCDGHDDDLRFSSQGTLFAT